MTTRHFSDSIVIARSPEDLYDMVSDVTRMGEWSPICKACSWEDGAGPRAGAWFTGHNETAERSWDTRSLVEVADRGRQFTFAVFGSRVRWSYTFAPADGGTRLTETWDFLDDGIASFHERYGADAENQMAERAEAAAKGIPVTLAAIKQAAERVS